MYPGCPITTHGIGSKAYSESFASEAVLSSDDRNSSSSSSSSSRTLPPKEGEYNITHLVSEHGFWHVRPETERRAGGHGKGELNPIRETK